jgi:inositol phosphorylceramide mannosyltransferase catalytic subunit
VPIEMNILQTWKSKSQIPANFQHWSETIRELNPEFVYYFWDDADNRTFIEANYPWFLKTYDAYPAEIYRVDAIRYFWLYHFGGVYIDMDSECLRPLERLCKNNAGVVLGQMGQDRTFVHAIPNAVMMSPSRDGFWLYVFHLMMSLQSKRRHPEDITGSIMLKMAVDAIESEADRPNVAAAIDTISALLPEQLRPKAASLPVKILPPECFFPVNWADPIHQNYFRRQIIKEERLLSRKRAAELFPKSYIVTYWAHSWDYSQCWSTE